MLLLQFFVLEVVANSIRLTDDNIYCQLKRIVQMADEGIAQGLRIDKVGMLTAASRDCWAKARSRLMQGHYIISYLLIQTHSTCWQLVKC